MKSFLRRLFSPILNIFESGAEPFNYTSSSRAILIILGSLFVGLAMLVTIFAPKSDFSFLLPVIIFGGMGALSLLIGFLGNDRAVSKIWSAKKAN